MLNSTEGGTVTIFVIIPVKKLDEAKSRLSPFLTDNERKRFCLKMLEDVLRAVKSAKRVHRTIVVSVDPAVRQSAFRFNASFLIESRPDLNQAVYEAVDWCIQEGAKSTLILPADIPLVAPIDIGKILSLGEKAAMVISSSRNGNGTNALLLTPPNAISPSYGPHSFQRHIDEASRRGISFHTFKSLRIALDIDTIEDLIDFISLNAKKTLAYKFLKKIESSERLGIF